MMAIVVRGFYTTGGVKEAFSIAYDHGRMDMFKYVLALKKDSLPPVY
jgi:hypothetical protein